MYIPNIVYKLGNGRLWSVREGCFVNEAALAEGGDGGAPLGRGGAEIIALRSAEGDEGVDYLARTLEAYGFPMGELALKTPEGVKRELAALDAEWLTPRTLAGLSRGDAEAQERWLAHEAKAEPLRARLAELLAAGAQGGQAGASQGQGQEPSSGQAAEAQGGQPEDGQDAGGDD